MIAAVVFVVGSVPIVWLSRRSFFRPAYHGFPRFFAFEAILALLVLNAPYWFVRPFGVPQLASWLLLSVSVVLIVWSSLLLRRFGQPRPISGESPMFELENTERLVTTGIYRYIRHPMYASLLFLAWGVLLKSISIGTVVLAGIATIALMATAKAEEAEDRVRFGQAYGEYMKRTHRFVPFLV